MRRRAEAVARVLTRVGVATRDGAFQPFVDRFLSGSAIGPFGLGGVLALASTAFDVTLTGGRLAATGSGWGVLLALPGWTLSLVIARGLFMFESRAPTGRLLAHPLFRDDAWAATCVLVTGLGVALLPAQAAGTTWEWLDVAAWASWSAATFIVGCTWVKPAPPPPAGRFAAAGA